jgi:hypothetical protein
METVEIREDPIFTPYCTVCKGALTTGVPSRLEASVIGTRHELEQHPDPDPEDA